VRDAVFKIELFKGKRSMSFGTGFFVSSDGTAVTNYHVFSDVLERGHRPVFTLHDGKKLSSKFRVVRCMDRRDIDLCILKLEHQAGAFLKVEATRPEAGSKIFTIGNPKGADFSLRRGRVKRIYRDIRKVIKINDYTRNRRVEMVRISGKLKKGFSGGPVVSEAGELVGVNSVIMHPPKKGGETLYLAVSAPELDRYMRLDTPFNLERFTRAQIRKNDILSTPIERLTEKQIKKACKTLQKDECLAGIKAACAAPTRRAECQRLREYFRGMLKRK